jgi:two-component system, OmpR family, phosphate regulon sensor histidine kinase PhoR
VEDEFGRLQDSLGSPWDRIAIAGRRALRVIAERDRAAASRLQELEAILYSTGSGFAALDAAHRVLDLNPAAAAWLGVSSSGAKGRLVQEVCRQPELNRFLDDAFEAKGTFERTIEITAPRPLILRAIGEPLRYSGGRTFVLLLSLQDVTRIRRLESLRSEFVANVSHELRTPITSIKGYVDTLLQVGLDDPTRARKFLEIVQRNTARLSALVEDLLALASLEQIRSDDSHGLEISTIRAGDIVNGVIELLGPAAEARGIRLLRDIDESISVLANATLAEQALSNLVSNAIRYSPDGSRVTLSVRPAARGGEARDSGASMAEFSVTDEGPGIGPKHLERIFERFYRVDKARSSSMGGTGLGLAIVKHIAQALGGSVEVKSELGAGSRFSILLPIPSSPNCALTNP